MNNVFVFLIVLSLAFAGYHISFRRIPLFGRHLYLTGTEFLFFGLALGPMGFRILTDAALEDLAPFTAMLPAVVGLISGLQLHLGRLLRMPSRHLTAGFAEGLVCAACLMIGFGGAAHADVLLSLFSRMPDGMGAGGGCGIPAALIGSAVLCVTVPTGLLLMTPSEVSRGAAGLLLQHIAVTNSLAGLMLFSLPWLMCAPGGFLSGLPALAALSGCLSLLLIAFLSLRRSPEELLLFTISVSVMTGGLARMIDFSPLLTGFLVGLVLANCSREGDRLLNLLIPLEKPVYLLLLLFLGALWPANYPLVWGIAVFLCLWRIAAKQVSGRVAVRIAVRMSDRANDLAVGSGREPISGGTIGSGLLGTGGLAMAMIFDAREALNMDGIQFLAAVVPAAILLSDLVSPAGLRRLSGEGKK